jgi:glyoxylase-like metal-dependent hydrolase (beta-lactamase superfamily II)
LCPLGGRLFGAAGGPWAPAPMCCHCLLIEGDHGLILVDSGLGVEDITDPKRLGLLFNWTIRPRLEVAETALRQVVDLGFRPTDLRHIIPTHLDLDHAGGLGDFPDATVHVFAPELRAAREPTLWERGRYRMAQLREVVNWAPLHVDGEEWFGFASVRALPGTRDDVLLIPLAGHSRGHCGVAVRAPEGWLLHCGDAYFHRSEVAPCGGLAPLGLRLFESLVNVDGAARRANQERLRQLTRATMGAVRLICSHDPAELAACKKRDSIDSDFIRRCDHERTDTRATRSRRDPPASIASLPLPIERRPHSDALARQSRTRRF